MTPVADNVKGPPGGGLFHGCRMDQLAIELVRAIRRAEVAEAAMLRLRRKLCEALKDQPEKLKAAREECGLCGGSGECEG